MDSRFPENRYNCAIVSSRQDSAIHTVPTGLLLEPPLGPATPVTARPNVVFAWLRTPNAIAIATSSGTDVARETADIIVTDDNFESIVDGVEEGRIAYANVRKVIFLLISTGAAELVLFVLSMITALPLPLLAVQLLWLNLVTNGIQDIALAFEPGEGGELRQSPRPPKEAIFNRIMLERVIISAIVIGVVAFGLFKYLLDQGFSLEQARNSTLLLMVLFENVHVFNSRSETLSVFRHNPLRNKLLLGGTIIAQLVHIGAMYTPLAWRCAWCEAG